MFTATALGHQGWLVGTGDTHVLIDPILTERFSRMPRSAATVFPPRALDLPRFPPIDAVLITHEHPDHLDPVSLQLLDPRTIVYLSAHSSDAARRTIASLGLEVRPLAPGVACSIGDMQVLPLAPYVIGEPGENEVDIVPLLLRDFAGHGSFFTSVDIVQVRDMVLEIRRHLDRPGIWTHANNAFVQGSCFDWAEPEADPVQRASELLVRRYAAIFDGWGHPEITLVNGDGLALGRDLATLNPHVFDVTSEALVASVASALPGHSFCAAPPGLTVTMREGEVVGTTATTSFLATDERAPRPVRGGAPFAKPRPDFGPGTGRRTLTAAEHAQLAASLQDFARFLFARASYRGLYRLMAERDHPATMRPTLALFLREGDARGGTVWELRPQSAAFVAVPCDDPRASYAAGAELWASDVLDVLTFAELADDLFHFGRKRLWNVAPQIFRCDLDTELQLFTHALRCPREIEALYRRCLDPEVRPLVPGPLGPTLGAPPKARPIRPARLRPLPPALAARISRMASGRGATPDANNDSASASLSIGREADLARGPLGRRVAQIVEQTTNGAWSLASVSRQARVVHLTLQRPDGVSVVLQAARPQDLPQRYRRTATLAFAYGPRDTTVETVRMLDRVIDALNGEEVDAFFSDLPP